MKSVILFLAACLISISGLAQDQEVKILFDVTSADEGTHKSTIRHVKFMSDAYPKSQFEIVLYSKSINMVLKDKSVVQEDLENLLARENVEVKICNGTMNRYELGKEALIEGVDIVPDGIMEIVMKQQEGWSYIKESHN